MRANHPHTQDRFRTSQATKQRLAARIPSVAGRINNRIQPCEGGTRDYAYDNINLHTIQTEATTALRVSTAARCTMHERAATTGSKTMRAAAPTLRIGSELVRRRCSDSQPTSIQSQVGCNRISHAMATRGTAEHDNIDLHTTQTEAITALRV